MPAENIDPAWDALTHGIDISHFASGKEQTLLYALGTRYKYQHTGDRKELDINYMNAMANLASTYPDDADIQTLYAESMMNLNPWNLYDNQGQPGEYTGNIIAALETALLIDPDHPGALHYFIHAIEPSNNPEKATAAAEILGSLVPVSGHLVHMPSHIYLRTGRYNDAVKANQDAVGADSLYVNQCNVQGFSSDPYYPHNLHFLWYAALMDGQRELAIETAREMYDASTQAQYSTIPLLTHLRFGQWQDALDKATLLQAESPDGINGAAAVPLHFSMAVATAKLGDEDSAATHLRHIESLLAEEGNQSPVNSIYHHVAQAMIAEASGAIGEKTTHLEAAVALQDELPYFEPPQLFMPLRQALAASYLVQQDYEKAKSLFRQDLTDNPNNAWSVLGLKQAQDATGQGLQSIFLADQFKKASENFSFELLTPSYL